MKTAVAVAATLVGLAFAMSVFERWLLRRRPYELAWSFALALFSVAAAALASGAAFGWDGPTFRLFYLFGAIVDVPFLAAGTVYLLWPRLGRSFFAGVALASCFAAGVVVSSHARPFGPSSLPQGSAVFPVLPRVLAAVGSGGGATVVLAGALVSLRRSVVSNGLIAVGTLVLGASGLFNSVFDAMTAFAVSLLIGICLLFAGFLLASSPVPAASELRRSPRALSAGSAAAASPSQPNVGADRRT